MGESVFQPELKRRAGATRSAAVEEPRLFNRDQRGHRPRRRNRRRLVPVEPGGDQPVVSPRRSSSGVGPSCGDTAEQNVRRASPYARNCRRQSAGRRKTLLTSFAARGVGIAAVVADHLWARPGRLRGQRACSCGAQPDPQDLARPPQEHARAPGSGAPAHDRRHEHGDPRWCVRRLAGRPLIRGARLGPAPCRTACAAP